MKTCLVLLCCLLGAVPSPLRAADQVVVAYTARLSVQDHLNSSGERLTTAAGVLRQDRANFHKFHRVDAEDKGDGYFAAPEHRDEFDALVARGDNDAAALRAIIERTPLVAVTVYRNGAGALSLKVRIVKDGGAAADTGGTPGPTPTPAKQPYIGDWKTADGSVIAFTADTISVGGHTWSYNNITDNAVYCLEITNPDDQLDPGNGNGGPEAGIFQGRFVELLYTADTPDTMDLHVYASRSDMEAEHGALVVRKGLRRVRAGRSAD